MTSKALTLRDTYLSSALQVILGSVFLAIMAQAAIPLPFTPVPISLQTLGVALLAIALGPQKAALSVIAYLTQATMGLPVLAGGMSNALWFLTPRAGYLLGFVASAFLTGTLLERVKQRGLFKTWAILATNEATIMLFGTLWLGFFVGSESSLAMGVLPFIPGAIAKITMATVSERPIKWMKS